MHSKIPAAADIEETKGETVMINTNGRGRSISLEADAIEIANNTQDI